MQPGGGPARPGRSSPFPSESQHRRYCEVGQAQGQTPPFDVTVPPTSARLDRGGTTSEERMADQARVDEGVMGTKLPTPGESRAAKWAGWFMAITFLTSIPALLLYHSILHDHNYILGS